MSSLKMLFENVDTRRNGSLQQSIAKRVTSFLEVRALFCGLKKNINLVVSFLIYYGFPFISIYLFIRGRQGIQRSIFKDRSRLNNGDPKLHRPQAARAGFNLEPRVLQDFITSSVATVDRPTSDTLVFGSDQWALASTQKQ